MATKRKTIKVRAAKLDLGACCEPNKCGGSCFGWGIVVLIIGILFLAKDYGLLNWFSLSWYTLVFILLGLKMIFCKK